MTAHKLDKRAFFFKKDLWFQRILKKSPCPPPPKKLVNNYCKKRIKETKKRHKTEKEKVRMDKNTVMDRQEGYRTSIRMGKHTKDEGQNTPTPRAAHRHPGNCPGHRCHRAQSGPAPSPWAAPPPSAWHGSHHCHPPHYVSCFSCLGDQTDRTETGP